MFGMGQRGKSFSHVGRRCLKLALIACCEEADLSVLDGVRIPVEWTAALNKWNMVGEVLVPGVLNRGDIEKTDGANRRLPWQISFKL